MFDRAQARLALAVALAAAFALAGCGRKGPLDPPPAAAISQPAPGTTAAAPTAADQAFDAQGRPIAPKGQDKSFPLDVLIR